MPSPALLQQLHLLDESSPQFPNRLSSLLHEETYNECTTNLRDEDWSWLVEYLDNVRPRVVFTDLLLNQYRPSTFYTPPTLHSGDACENSG